MRDGIYDAQAEMAGLGAIMLQQTPARAKKLVEMLAPGDFYIPAHARFFECFQDLLRRGKALDLNTVPAWFETPTKDGGMASSIESVGGVLYLHEILESCPSSHNGEHYVGTVVHLSTVRKLRESAQSIVEELVTERLEPEEMWAEAVKRIQACKPHGGEMVSLGDIKNAGKPQGVPTHLPKLNKISGCGGLPMGQMAVFAARKKVGKSSGLIAAALHACARGHRIGYYTLADLDASAVKQRCIQQWTGLEKQPDDFEGLEVWKAAEAAFDMFDFYIRDVNTGASKYAERLAATISQDHDRKKFSLVCVDYCQKLKCGYERDRVRQQEIASGIMSDLAAECGFALAIGSQLNENGQTRYSQEWEDDAGLVVHFARPDMNQPLVEVDVPYNRFGPSRSFNGAWDDKRLIVVEEV